MVSNRPPRSGGGGGGTSTSSSKNHRVVFILPLIVVFGLISLLAPTTYKWVFTTHYFLAGPTSNSSEIGAPNGDVLVFGSDDYAQNHSQVSIMDTSMYNP